MYNMSWLELFYVCLIHAIMKLRSYKKAMLMMWSIYIYLLEQHPNCDPHKMVCMWRTYCGCKDGAFLQVSTDIHPPPLHLKHPFQLEKNERYG